MKVYQSSNRSWVLRLSELLQPSSEAYTLLFGPGQRYCGYWIFGISTTWILDIWDSWELFFEFALMMKIVIFSNKKILFWNKNFQLKTTIIKKFHLRCLRLSSSLLFYNLLHNLFPCFLLRDGGWTGLDSKRFTGTTLPVFSPNNIRNGKKKSAGSRKSLELVIVNSRTISYLLHEM